MKKKRVAQKIKLKLGIFSCLALSIFLFFFSVVTALDSANLNYEKISKLNSINELIDDNEKLEIKLTNLKASKNLRDEAVSLGMVGISSVKYVSVGAGSVVLNR